MISPKEIGASIVSAVLLLVIFSHLWPLLPKEGMFSDISFGLMAVVGVVAGLIVIGPGKIGMSILSELE